MVEFLHILPFLLLSVAASPQDPCYSNPCGFNTRCFVKSGRPVCSCLQDYHGNPLTGCQRGECADNTGCPESRACQNNKCIDPCVGQCGINANCNVKNHVAVCSCPHSYKGDPFTRCRQMDPQELCHPSPCGANTNCNVVNGIPICSCLPGYIGQPLTGCRHECLSDGECSVSQLCRNYKCVHACESYICGRDAICEVVNHRPVCRCPKNYLGDPYLSCRVECVTSADCLVEREICHNNKCIDPCKGLCGINANCKVRGGTTAVCSCPKDMTGDPFVRCRPFTKEELCLPNPCGANAQCTPGFDNSGMHRPVCTCPPGYVGNALVSCRRGECEDDGDCGSHEVCDSNYNCINPCKDQCGVGAECQVRNHIALCRCPPKTEGNALVQCNPILHSHETLESWDSN